jgi:imidazole glycerol-phosphate synthase subunit HisH
MEKTDALLIDAGTGNLHSVHNALQQLGFHIFLSSRPEDLAGFSGRVILPGVGAFGGFMQGLRDRNLIEPLQEACRRGSLMLGICVGMQALFAISEELGQHPGLDLLAGRVVRFPNFQDRKVPHTGWNQLWFQDGAALFKHMQNGAYAYFNHSYYCANDNLEDTAATTDYGIDFTSSIQHENLFGVQFHPEKSQGVGLQVLRNFFKV